VHNKFVSSGTLTLDLISQGEGVNEEQVLISQAQKDPEAAGRLYDRYYGGIFSYICHSTLDHDWSEDLTSNVFLVAFRHLGRFRWRRIPFRAWLYRIATKEIRMYYRRRKRSRVTPLDASNNDRPCDAPSALDNMSTAEDHQVLHWALGELQSKYPAVIILRYFEDKPLAELAEILCQREGTIKSQLHRGLARLQEILRSQGIVPH